MSEHETKGKANIVMPHFYDVEIGIGTGQNGGPTASVRVTVLSKSHEEVTIKCDLGDTDEDMRVFSGGWYSVSSEWDMPMCVCKTIGEAVLSDFLEEYMVAFAIADEMLRGTKYSPIDRVNAFIGSPECERMIEEKRRSEAAMREAIANMNFTPRSNKKIKFPKRG